MNHDPKVDLSRRRTIVTGASAVAGLLASHASGVASAEAMAQPEEARARARLPVEQMEQMEQILRTEGSIDNGVLSISRTVTTSTTLERTNADFKH
jgi:hypothetical protein